MLGDPQRHALYAVVEPGSDGGALEINLPRNALDAKSDTGTDISYIVKIDGQRISGEPSGICVGTCPNIFNSFKATGNTSTDRVLTIVFGPESRFIEIIAIVAYDDKPYYFSVIDTIWLKEEEQCY